MSFLDFSDKTATSIGVVTIGEKCQPGGSIENLDRAVLADTSAIVLGSLLSTSSLITYLESAAGIREG